MTRHAEALARRLASPCDRGRAPLGAPPWRFLGLRVRVSGSGIILRSACSDAPRGRVLVSGERFPCLPGLRLRAAAAERHSPLRLWTVSGRRPSRAGMAGIWSNSGILSRTKRELLAPNPA